MDERAVKDERTELSERRRVALKCVWYALFDAIRGDDERLAAAARAEVLYRGRLAEDYVDVWKKVSVVFEQNADDFKRYAEMLE